MHMKKYILIFLLFFILISSSITFVTSDNINIVDDKYINKHVTYFYKMFIGNTSYNYHNISISNYGATGKVVDVDFHDKTYRKINLIDTAGTDLVFNLTYDSDDSFIKSSFGFIYDNTKSITIREHRYFDVTYVTATKTIVKYNISVANNQLINVSYDISGSGLTQLGSKLMDSDMFNITLTPVILGADTIYYSCGLNGSAYGDTSTFYETSDGDYHITSVNFKTYCDNDLYLDHFEFTSGSDLYDSVLKWRGDVASTGIEEWESYPFGKNAQTLPMIINNYWGGRINPLVQISGGEFVANAGFTNWQDLDAPGSYRIKAMVILFRDELNWDRDDWLYQRVELNDFGDQQITLMQADNFERIYLSDHWHYIVYWYWPDDWWFTFDSQYLFFNQYNSWSTDAQMSSGVPNENWFRDDGYFKTGLWDGSWQNSADHDTDPLWLLYWDVVAYDDNYYNVDVISNTPPNYFNNTWCRYDVAMECLNPDITSATFTVLNPLDEVVMTEAITDDFGGDIYFEQFDSTFNSEGFWEIYVNDSNGVGFYRQFEVLPFEGLNPDYGLRLTTQDPMENMIVHFEFNITQGLSANFRLINGTSHLIDEYYCSGSGDWDSFQIVIPSGNISYPYDPCHAGLYYTTNSTLIENTDFSFYVWDEDLPGTNIFTSPEPNSIFQPGDKILFEGFLTDPLYLHIGYWDPEGGWVYDPNFEWSGYFYDVGGFFYEHPIPPASEPGLCLAVLSTNQDRDLTEFVIDHLYFNIGEPSGEGSWSDNEIPAYMSVFGLMICLGAGIMSVIWTKEGFLFFPTFVGCLFILSVPSLGQWQMIQFSHAIIIIVGMALLAFILWVKK